jgi:hypothetical protein
MESAGSNEDDITMKLMQIIEACPLERHRLLSQPHLARR